MSRSKRGCWLASPDVVFIEIAADLGYGALVLDAEHGTFALADAFFRTPDLTKVT